MFFFWKKKKVVPPQTDPGPRPADSAKPPAGAAGGPRAQDLGELLLQTGVITADQMKRAVDQRAMAEGGLVTILLAQGAVTEQQIVSALSQRARVPFLRLRNFPIPASLVARLPADIARRHLVIPVGKVGDVLRLGMVDPLDGAAVRRVREAMGSRVMPVVCGYSELKACLEKYYPVAMPAPAAVPAPAPKAAAPPPAGKPAPSPVASVRMPDDVRPAVPVSEEELIRSCTRRVPALFSTWETSQRDAGLREAEPVPEPIFDGLVEKEPPT
ncbi:MAG: hypothetical protein V1809_02285 [Planctomycetota bacterium]